MKVSLIGPTNMKKFSKIIGRTMSEIEQIAKKTGKIIAQNKATLTVVFNYAGMLKLAGDSYKKNDGMLEMLYTENDSDWDTDIYMDCLKEADIKIKKDSWHDMLLSLVTDVDVVICAGLSAGTFAELGYMKWNYQDKKGKVKALIGIKEFLKDGKFPPEFEDMEKIIVVTSVADLDNVLKKFR